MKEKRTLSFKQKMVLVGTSVFSLSLAVSVVTTYAWYSIREITMVSHLNMVLNADDYLKLGIMKDGEIVFDEVFTNEDLGNEKLVLDQVTNMYDYTWLNDDTDMETALPTYRSAYRTKYSAREVLPDAPVTDYVQNVFYLEASRSGHVYLGDTSYVLANKEDNHSIALLYNLDEDKLNEVVNAARISFFSSDGYVVCNPGESIETYYGGILDLDGDGYYDYDDNTKKEIIYGDVVSEPTYDNYTYAGEQYDIKDKTVFNANHSADAYEAKNYEVKKENSIPLKQLIYSSAADEADPEYVTPTPIMELQAGVPKRIVITIYLEGWDLYMTNFLARACFDVSLTFTALFDIV